MQERIGSAGWRPLRSAFRGLAWLGGALALAAASAVGAVLALVFATTLVVISFMGLVVLALAGAAVRARRSMREAPDPDVIEARHMGGHSWVAYGWDGRR
jgi:hypothetical protein